MTDSEPVPTDLDELERRVTERFIDRTRSEWDLPETPTLDWSDWLGPMTPPAGQTIEISTVGQPLPPPLQFPRPQWIIYPNSRVIALMICDRALDLWDDLTIEQRAQIAFLLEHGGRERIA